MVLDVYNNPDVLLEDGDYFILSPMGDYWSYSATIPISIKSLNEDSEQKLQYLKMRVNQCNPNDLDVNLNYTNYKVTFTWEDADVNDQWNVTIGCDVGKWSDNSKSKPISGLTTRSLTEQWDNNGQTDRFVTFTLSVTDSSGINDTIKVKRLLVSSSGAIHSKVNKLWLTYVCNNYPPKKGDYVYVYGHLSNNYAAMFGQTGVVLWTTPNTLKIASEKASIGVPAEKPNSYFNIGGRGRLETYLDKITDIGAVDTTPANTYFLDRKEYIETLDLLDDTDYGIYGQSSLYGLTFWNTEYVRKNFLIRQTRYENTMNYKSIVPKQGLKFTDVLECKVLSRINDGNSVWAYQAGSCAGSFRRSFRNGSGYLWNFVFKVTATAGQKVKLGIIPAYIPNDLNKVYPTTYYDTMDWSNRTAFYSANNWAELILPMNNIEFIVGN